MERPSWTQPGRTFLGGVCFGGLFSRCFFMSNIWVNIVRIWGFLGTWNRQKNWIIFIPKWSFKLVSKIIATWSPRIVENRALARAGCQILLHSEVRKMEAKWSQLGGMLGPKSVQTWFWSSPQKEGDEHHEEVCKNGANMASNMEPQTSKIFCNPSPSSVLLVTSSPRRPQIVKIYDFSCQKRVENPLFFVP